MTAPNLSTVTEVSIYGIFFDDGHRLSSDHDSDCCEQHYLNFADLELNDFDGLLFDLSGEAWFERIPDYGIALLPANGHPVRIAGHAYNNGYYSDQLTLVLKRPGVSAREFDITECQSEPCG